MNLLLVDDEVIIVSLLKKHIAWKELGIEEVLIAYTAAEARRSVEDHAVDIIKPVFLSPYPCRRWKNIVIITEKIKTFI